MVNEQLVNQVRAYQTAKLQAANKSRPFSTQEWLAFDVKKLLEEVGELVEQCLGYQATRVGSRYVKEEIADVAIALACIASNFGFEIAPAMDEKLAILRLRLEEMGCKQEELT